jgi:hypothetical protein
MPAVEGIAVGSLMGVMAVTVALRLLLEIASHLATNKPKRSKLSLQIRLPLS